MNRAIPSGRAIAVYLLIAGLSFAALKNVYTYRQIMGAKWEETRRLTALLDERTSGDGQPNEARDRQLRRDFYALLLSLGGVPPQNGRKTAVVVVDPEFYRGAYIDRPLDTTLQRCAIQPFSIPALTGMPLLGALRARGSECHYDSYGYQYLPQKSALSASDLAEPCTLARERGFDRVVVIDRHDASFSARSIDCAGG